MEESKLKKLYLSELRRGGRPPRFPYAITEYPRILAMNQLNHVSSQADAAEGPVFIGNLSRASLLAGELATRRPHSRQARDTAAGAGAYPQAGGAIIYQRGDGGQALGNLTHMERGVNWEGWQWAVIVTIVLLATLGLMSGSGIGSDISLMLHKLM
jgi:hypothetical protein